MRKQPIKEKLGDLAQVLLVLLGYLIEYIWTTIVLIIKFPMFASQSKNMIGWITEAEDFLPFRDRDIVLSVNVVELAAKAIGRV
jgi:hypothetical protein